MIAHTVYRVHIDGRTVYARTTLPRLRTAMSAHIKTERAKGRPLSEIEYTWTLVNIITI